MISRVFAVDPGPTRSGAALVELLESGWLAILWGGHVENHGPELAAQIASAARADVFFVCEKLEGYAFQASRVAQLMETAKAEERIVRDVEIAIERAAIERRARSVAASGLPNPFPALPTTALARVTAGDWRGELCRSKTASDAQIRLVVEGLCPVRPALKADARPHVYDAAGLGIVALARANGRRIELPASVSSALHVMQVSEKADRSARRAKGLPAVEKTKRSPTRAQTARRSEAAKAGWSKRKVGA